MSELNKPMDITSVLRESRIFKPRKEFAKTARLKSLAQYRKLYKRVHQVARKVLGEPGQERNWSGSSPGESVAVEGAVREMVRRRAVNVSYNCLDKWLDTPTAQPGGG